MKKTTQRFGFLQPALLLLASNAFISIASLPYGAFIGVYYNKQGMTKGEIGILISVVAIASICIQPIWAYISDRTGRRKDVLCLVVAGCAVSSLGFYLANSFLGYFCVALLFAAFFSAVSPLCDALVVRRAAEIRADYSHIRLAGTISYAVAVNIIGLVLRMDIRFLFALTAVFYLLMLLVVRKLPDSTPPTPKVAGPAPKTSRRVFTSQRVGFVLALAVIGYMGLAFYGAYMGIFVMELGYNESVLGLLNCIGALSEIPVLLFISKYVRKWDIMKLLSFSCLCVAVRLALLSTGALPFIVLGQLFSGVSFIMLYYCCVIYISEHAAEGKMSQSQSIFAVLSTGVGCIIGQIGGGFLVEHLTMRTSFIAVAAGIVLIVGGNALLYRLYKKRGFHFIRPRCEVPCAEKQA